jgi:hypothetical protein
MLCILCYEKLIIDLFNEKQNLQMKFMGKQKKNPSVSCWWFRVDILGQMTDHALNNPLQVYGPEATMTGICKQAIECIMAAA